MAISCEMARARTFCLKQFTFSKLNCSKIIVSVLGIALTAATMLKAEDDKSRFTVGISFVNPIGDKTKIGLGFGSFFTAETNLTDKQILQGILSEYVPFSEGKYGFETHKNKRMASTLSAKEDWIYSFNSENHGQYVPYGTGVMENKQKLIEPFSCRLLAPIYYQMIEYNRINYKWVYIVPGINWEQPFPR
ncbi:MAG: hypothetical protein LBH03_01655 [Holophagales bacterium]|nr:hypothetical protein [Holophagales bacterium]